MGNTSAEALAVLLAGGRLESVAGLAALPASELFGAVIEPLADSFDPALIQVYVDVFARLIAHVQPVYPAADLVERYARLRLSRPALEPARVVVLSRVTLGADVAITSTLLAAAMKQWPEAEICFAGSAKNFELFAGNPRLRHLPVPYGRGATLQERIAAGMALAPLVDDPRTLVIDPDSRLSQLGLLPLAAVERTLFFESRGAGGPADSLVSLASEFARETLGVSARPWIDPPAPEWVPRADVAVSFGVGENAAKRVPGDFELTLVQDLLSRGLHVLLDSGAPGTAEAERAAHIESECQGALIVWSGSFAPFAAAIARSRLYIGYDSAGQHVAAACGVPRITVFSGHGSERFVARWRPDGPGSSQILFPSPNLQRELSEAVDIALARS